MKLKIEIEYENNHERRQRLRRVNSLISSGLRSFKSKEYSFAIDHDVSLPNLVRFEEINGNVCMIIQSKMNVK